MLVSTLWVYRSLLILYVSSDTSDPASAVGTSAVSVSALLSIDRYYHDGVTLLAGVRSYHVHTPGGIHRAMYILPTLDSTCMLVEVVVL